MRRKLLWVGDAGVPSGFARATHEILDVVRDTFDVTVLGINYRGDPHPYPYEIWAAAPGGDLLGIGRLIWMCDKCRPDVIVLQNDGWNIPLYLRQLVRFPEYANIPVVAALAVDGKNFQAWWLDGVAYAVFWTQFGLDEARAGGYEGPATVIPLGVRRETYHPASRDDARRAIFKDALQDAFIVGNVNRNQLRKRWDLCVRYFVRWVKQLDVSATEDDMRRAPLAIDNAYLFLHSAPVGDAGFNVRELMLYYGAVERLAHREPPVWYGVSEDEMRDTYNCSDVAVTTTQGEGMGLTAMEAMACERALIAPDWSALGDWGRRAMDLVPCTATAATYAGSVIGGVADEMAFVRALDRLYRQPARRAALGLAGLSRVSEPRFDWCYIGRRYANLLDHVADHQSTEEEEVA